MFHLVFLESHPIDEAVLRDSLSLQFSDLSDVPILIGQSVYNSQLHDLVDNGSVLVLLCHLSCLLGVTLSLLQASGIRQLVNPQVTFLQHCCLCVTEKGCEI